MSAVGRRAFLVATLCGCVLPRVATAQPSDGFASVAVDVGPLRGKGLGDYAELVRRVVQAELAGAFSDRIRPGGPRLVVRIDAISQGQYAGAENRLGVGGAIPNDYLDGEALVFGPRGEVLSRLPQLSVLPANSGGAWYDPESEGRRLVAIARHYAAWLRRRL